MQNPSDSYVTKPLKSLGHHPSKCIKNIYRSSHYKSHKYADIGFTITKLNKKYVAHCRICNRTLGNTAYARLKGHRNICRESSLDNDLECPLYPVSAGQVYVCNENDITPQKYVPEAANDSPTLITPKIEKVECELNEDLPPYYNPGQESKLLNEENHLKLNMIEVLLPIKYNKKLLFEDNTQKSVNKWNEVLKKAQTLGLAPIGASWNYARDTLYSAWRHLTLQKKDAIESGELNVKYNIVDLSILQIEDTPMQTDSSSFENEDIYETATGNESIFNKTIDDWTSENRTTMSTQTSDEMYKTELRLKILQCEAMEIDNYKRSLEALELERKLQIPNSKFTAKYFPTTQTRSDENRWTKDLSY